MNRQDNAARMGKLVSAFRNSEMGYEKFATSHGITKGKLIYWVKRLGDRPGISYPQDPGKFIPLDLSFNNTDEPHYIIINKPCGTQIKIPI